MQFPLYAIPLILAALFSLSLAWVIWQRRPGNGVTAFTVLMIALTIWTLAEAFKGMSEGLTGKVFFVNIAFIGITTVPAAWLLFAADFTGRGKWITPRNLRLLAIEPMVIVLLGFTNRFHELRYTSAVLDTSGDYTVAVLEAGVAFWIHAVYSYILIVAGIVFFIQEAIRSPKLYRGQMTMLIIGAFVPSIVNAAYVFGDVNPGFDPTPLGFIVTGVAMSWSLYRYRLMDIVPVARDTIIESMGDAMMVLDNQNRIVDINPNALKLLDSTASEAIGKTAGEALSNVQHLVDQFRDVMETNSQVTVGEGSKKRTFDLRISPLLNRHGDLTGRIYLMHEITDLKRASQQIKTQNEMLMETNRELAIAREKAEESNRLKSEFLATMSHELRTPLNSVIGFADLMLTGMMGNLNEKHQDYVTRIHSNGERLLSLINDILDISKIEAEQLELQDAPFEVNDLLQTVVRRMQPLAEQKGLELSSEIDADLPKLLMGDAGRLEQVLTNLASNAVRFTQKGKVGIRIEKANNTQWQIVVKDTGRGIPTDALEYIFDEFRQVDGSYHREHDGTGLGLAIVNKLVRLMNGTVRAESELGKGSTFTVTLPTISSDVVSTGATD